MIYDKTGHDSRFKFSEEFVVFKEEQQYKLKMPAYFQVPADTWDKPTVDIAHSLRAWKIDGADMSPLIVSNNPADELTADVFVRDCSESDQVKSEMLAVRGSEIGYNPTFATIIQVNLISASEEIKPKYTIRLEYQSPMRENLQVVEDYDGQGPKYSPSMMRETLARIAKLENSSGVRSVFGTAISNSAILDEDPSGAAPENYVRYERHDLNVSAGINLIQPARGPFYGYDVTVQAFREKNYTLNEHMLSDEALDEGIKEDGLYLFSYSDTKKLTESNIHIATKQSVILNGRKGAREFLEFLGDESVTGTIIDMKSDDFVTLTEGTDYVFDSIDVGRTARTSHTSGVYKNIKFLSSRGGNEVLVSYHAFGGVATAVDMRALNQEVKNTRTIIADTGLLTEHSLKEATYIKMLNKRLTQIEEFHSHFGQVEHRVSSKVAGFHWFNVAAIYDDNWGSKVGVTSDIGQFKISSALRKWSYDFIVDVDLDRKPGDILRLKTLGTNQYAGNGKDAIEKALLQDQVACRLCWIGDGSVSGVVLQIGWNFECYKHEEYPVDTDTITVTNKSGNSSLWHLLSDPEQVGYVADSSINVYLHQKFMPTTDKTVNGSKKYYRYGDVYKYVPTVDLVVLPGKSYFYRTAEDVGGTTVYEYDLIPSTIATIDRVMDSVVSRVGIVYEQLFIGHQVVEATGLIEGDSISEDLYEITSASYSEDEMFTMPGGSNTVTWSVTDPECKACAKIIEPGDGVIAWAGCKDITEYAQKEHDCAECEDEVYKGASPITTSTATFSSTLNIDNELHKFMHCESVKGITLMMHDKAENLFTVAYAPTYETSDGVRADVVIDIADMCMAQVGIREVDVTSSDYASGYQKEIVGGVETGNYSFVIQEIPAGNKLIVATLRASLGTFSIINKRFDLRQIRLHF